MSQDRDEEEPDVRESAYWAECAAEDIKRADEWFDELHPLVDRCFRGLGVRTGIAVQDNGFEITIPGEATGPEYQRRVALLDGLAFSDHEFVSVSLRRFAREPKRRGM